MTGPPQPGRTGCPDGVDGVEDDGRGQREGAHVGPGGGAHGVGDRGGQGGDRVLAHPLGHRGLVIGVF